MNDITDNEMDDPQEKKEKPSKKTTQTKTKAKIKKNKKPAKKKKDKKKKSKPLISTKKKLLLGGGFVLFILVYLAMQPVYIKGSKLFGVCRTFIELNVQYPSELRFVDLRERGPDVAVEYMTVDSFGQNISHRGTCMFKREETGQILMDYFYLRRGVKDREYLFDIEDPKKVEEFNLTVPFLLEQENMDLIVQGPARTLKRLTHVQ